MDKQTYEKYQAFLAQRKAANPALLFAWKMLNENGQLADTSDEETIQKVIDFTGWLQNRMTSAI